MPREVPLGRRVVVLVGLVGLGDLAERREHVVLLGPGSWSGALERGVSLNGCGLRRSSNRVIECL